MSANSEHLFMLFDQVTRMTKFLFRVYTQNKHNFNFSLSVIPIPIQV